MNNSVVASIFKEIAIILTLKDENPFRIRAYQKAAESLERLSEDVADICARDELTEIPGVGQDLSGKIKEFLATGKIAYHQELRRKVPPALFELLTVPGIGPKTAQVIFSKLRPQSLKELENLARQQKIRKLPGLREKTEQNILQGIAMVTKGRERSLLAKAVPIAEQIIAEMSRLPETGRVTCAGSVRRRCDSIRDIDILVTSAKPVPVMDAFIQFPGVIRVLGKGKTKSSVIFREGIQVDLRVVPDESFGAALLYFTGSKDHNIKLRTLAKKKGWKINEYGLFIEKSGRMIAGRTEDEMYKALGLSWIPPELREDHGEIEAAAAGKLPDLLTEEDIRGDFHMHSKWSDGYNEIEEMMKRARERKLQYVVLTDHSQSLKVANGLTPKRLYEQIGILRRLGAKFKDMKILAGAEVDILADGSLDYDDNVLSKLDFVVASVHSGFKQDKAQLTRRVIRAMQNPHVNLIGHPTGRLIGTRAGYELDLEAVYKEARKTNTALEINSQPDRLDLSDVNARRAAELGVMLAVDTDAHSLKQFENLQFGIATARRAWCTRKQILNCLSYDDFRKRIRKN